MENGQQYIYVLQLRKNKWYVGKTATPRKRYMQHLSGAGSSWTTQHKPIKMHFGCKSTDPFDELKYTLIFMAKYGINNVRGANFCAVELSKAEIGVLDSMLTGEEGRCYVCREKGHYARDCNAAFSNDIKEEILSDDDDDDDDEGDDDDDDDSGSEENISDEDYEESSWSSSSSSSSDESSSSSSSSSSHSSCHSRAERYQSLLKRRRRK